MSTAGPDTERPAAQNGAGTPGSRSSSPSLYPASTAPAAFVTHIPQRTAFFEEHDRAQGEHPAEIHREPVSDDVRQALPALGMEAIFRSR